MEADELELELQADSKMDDDELLTVIRQHYEEDSEAAEENHRTAEEDIKFRNGDQWSEQSKKQRRNKPCLISNHTNQFIYQVVNEIRQQRPAIKVQPVDDKADVKTAEIIQGIVRHIEYQSNASVAYDSAAEQAVDGGFGYFRIHADYSDDNTFEQDLFIKRIANRFSVLFDRNCTEPDNSDAMRAFVIDEMSRAEFKTAWPDAEVSSWAEGMSVKSDWVTRSTVRVAEYFCVKHVEKINLLLSDGSSMWEDDESDPPVGTTVVQQRKVKRREVHWYKVNGHEVLERGKWLGRWIPIIPIFGNEHWIDGKRVLYGLTRNLKDPQRLRNYWLSIEAEFLQKSSKAPVVGAKGQFKGVERQWAEAHVSDVPFLEYNQKDDQGIAAPPPQRVGFPIPPSGILAASQETVNDMKAVTGIYDNSLGKQGNEVSGKAIIARQKEGDTATFHYIDNVSRAIRFCGLQIVDLIPHYYDSAKVARCIGEDGTTKQVMINQPFVDKDGKTKIYDLTVGKYDVVVSSGPSYQSKREQAADSMMQFIQAYPMAAPLVGDLIAKNMDWPGADAIAARLKASVPPQIVQASESGNEQDAAVMQAQQGAQQAIQQAQQEAQAHIQEIGQQAQEAQQQVQQLTAQAQADKANKDLEAQKLQMDFQIKQAELALKSRDLDLKEQDLNFREAEALSALNHQRDLAAHKADLDLANLQMQADAAAKADQEKQEAADKEAQAQAEGETESQELQQIMQVQQETLQALQSISEMLSKPKKIVRGPDGRVAGVE